MISFLCGPQTAPEKWAALSPPRKIQVQRQMTASSWPEESPKLPSPTPAHGPGPPKGGPASPIRYEPRGNSMCHRPAAALWLSLVQLHLQHLLGEGCKTSPPRSRCQERDLVLMRILSLPLLNTSCAACSHSIALNLLQSRPIPNSGQKDNAEVINVLGTVSGIQDPPHPSREHPPISTTP